MTVIRARVLGFCMGVRRAVEMAETELGRQAAGPSARVYSLGPLIHNPQTLAALEGKGLSVIDECDPGSARFPRDAAVIIRAHGVAPDVEQALRESFTRVVDATCPRVRASQKTARRLAEGGCRVFIAGEKNHAEVRGVAGHVAAAGGGSAIIVGNAPEAEKSARELRIAAPDTRTALVAQTTFSPEEYAAVTAAIRLCFPDLEVKDTICPATRERQDALRDLCAGVDAIIVAGGNESANTRRLAAIARASGKRAFCVENAAELAECAELAGSAAAGLCAGASTPDAVIDEIERALRAL
jgi:4-hydroxy-3-methylbut-2-enyl diphosphate reductase